MALKENNGTATGSMGRGNFGISGRQIPSYKSRKDMDIVSFGSLWEWN